MRRRVLAAAVGATLSACTVLTDFEGLSTGAIDAAGEPDASGDPVDASGGGDADAPEASGCKGTNGPVPIRIDGYCIDSTEVTYAQYEEFLVAKAGNTADQPSECAWNTDFRVTRGGAKDTPIHGADWCDALAYCTWAGKRLCGRIGGGPTPSAVVNLAGGSEWYRACSKDGTQAFPYGDELESERCNGFGGDSPEPVKSFPGCEGGYPGIFDMSGNLWEWENSCEDGGATARCFIRGGSYAANNQGSCTTTAQIQRDRGTTGDVTIRCCSDVN